MIKKLKALLKQDIMKFFLGISLIPGIGGAAYNYATARDFTNPRIKEVLEEQREIASQDWEAYLYKMSTDKEAAYRYFENDSEIRRYKELEQKEKEIYLDSFHPELIKAGAIGAGAGFGIYFSTVGLSAIVASLLTCNCNKRDLEER